MANILKKITAIFKSIIFLLIFIIIFSYFSNLFCRKTLNGEWNHTQKISGFYNEPKNEFDIIYFGSSNTYCSFNPLIMYEKTGIKSYVFATQQQPVWASYTYMKEALKTQKPKLLVMDILMFAKSDEYYDDGVNYSFMDDIPFSKNKIELAFASSPDTTGRIRLLINFIKYHSRWSELTKDDYTFERSNTKDFLKGYVFLNNTFTDAVMPDTSSSETAPLSEKELLYFEKIISLAKEENIPILFVKTPSNATYDEQKLFNSVFLKAKELNVNFIDYNKQYDRIGLIINEDFYDKSHLNYKGAEKFTRSFAEDILSFCPDFPKNADDTDWTESLNKYYQTIKELDNPE